MSVVRVEKTKNYTTMSNYHFKEKEMSLKAKGLLSLMLSLPNDWDYTIAGLVSICKENETAIKSTLNELKQFGYLQVIKNKPTKENGGRIDYEYIIHEKPIIQEYKKQDVENLPVEIQDVENQLQLNTNKLNTNNKENIIINNNIDENLKNDTNNILTKSKKEKKLTKKQENAIECKKILDEFIKDEDEQLQKVLKDYIEVRKTKGLNPVQLKLILEEFEKAYSNKPLNVILEHVKKATARGWLALVYDDNFKGKTKSSYSSKPTFDNTSTHEIKIHHISDEEFDKLTHEEKLLEMEKFEAVADMTIKQRAFYYTYCLAKDENGDDLKF